MKEDIRNGWGGVRALEEWKCPKCSKVSNTENWKEIETYCEDCGSHDGRECPECEERFDYVWNDDLIGVNE